MKASIRYINGPAQVMRRMLRATEEAAKEIVEEWHAETMPGHFQRSAQNKYRYTPRKKGYQIRKAKQHGHQRPLVFSGESERDARAGIRLSSRRLGGGIIRARGAMHHLQKKFYQYNRMFTQIDKAAELTATTATEQSVMAGKMRSKTMAKLLLDNAPRETVRVV